MENQIIIAANDCCVFKNQEGHADAIQYFLSNRKLLNVFHFQQKEDDDNEIAIFNYRDAKWYAGRLIGEATFIYNHTNYKISIKPRFGNIQLFKMLEEVFNIKLTNSNSKIEIQKEYQLLIKNIIAFLWLNMLSKANKHGIPKHNIKKTYKGTKIRGKLDVRKSMISIYAEEKISSNYVEKAADETIAKIIKTAYKILKSEYNLGSIKPSLSAKNAIEQLFTSKVLEGYVSDNEYHKIQYKAIYLSFKPIVDLSWDIIKKKNFGNNDNNQSDAVSFFIDMAEIWEMYLRAILKRNLAKEGWHLRNDSIKTYPNKDFSRKLIPDIVFEKESNVMVWDAKYKKMDFMYYDYDRSDFFQIHTYISYYNQNKNVIAAGLLYPFSKEFDVIRQQKNSADTLFSENKTPISYKIDGIDYTNLSMEKMEIEETNFLNRISSITKVRTNG